MPVFSAVITSKRARRGRLPDYHGKPESDEIRKFKRQLERVAGSQESTGAQRHNTTSAGDSSKPSHIVSIKSAPMSAWQTDDDQTPEPTSKGMSLSHNTSINGHAPSNSLPGSNSPPKTTKPDIPNGVERSFQRRRSFSSRKRDVDDILTKHPHKVPIIIERARKEKSLILLDKSKFLVPEELTMSQLTTIIRRRLQLSDTQAFYLIINRRTMVSASLTLAEVYRRDKDADGFLYIVYASQEMFG